MNEPVLALEGVSKSFGDFKAVDDVSFEVPAGTVYGFLGPNGAGKTTTIRMILSIYEPTSGRISVLGKPSALDVRERIGYLPEEKGLYKKMKAWALIAYFGQLKGMDRRSAKAKALELLDRYGLGEFSNAKCEALSKGMGQKVQVLASIAHDPEFVILDEPFSGLDPVNQDVMEGVIRDMKERGRTIIFSTHIMEHAERLCDQLVLIARGRKIFDGTPKEASASIPRRIAVETDASPDVLERLPGVTAVASAAPDVTGAPIDGRWELSMAADAKAEDVLRACFEGGISLRAFDRNEPGLRDVFIHLVGAEEAAEVIA